LFDFVKLKLSSLDGFRGEAGSEVPSLFDIIAGDDNYVEKAGALLEKNRGKRRRAA
jgi:hypothetical protein